VGGACSTHRGDDKRAQNFLKSLNHAEPIRTLFRQNAELLNVEVGGQYNHHWVLKCKY
jgi:hypothetical protein